MIAPDDPSLARNHAQLLAQITAQGVEAWLTDKAQPVGVDSLVYLCKFAYFTGLLRKKDIGAILQMDRTERKALVRSWYNDHREKGCGTC